MEGISTGFDPAVGIGENTRLAHACGAAFDAAGPAAFNLQPGTPTMAQIDAISPGQRVNVKIVRRPTNAAAEKTLVRLLSKDPVVRQEAERQRKVRRSNLGSKIRGGRVWYQRVVKQPATRAEVGRTGSVRATVDVLRDLGSVERFVELTPE